MTAEKSLEQEWIKNVKKGEILLSEEDLKASRIENLTPLFASNDCPKELYIESAVTSFDNEDAKILAAALKTSSTSLEKLTLVFPNTLIGHAGAIAIIDTLASLKHVKFIELNLDHNNIDNDSAKSIANASIANNFFSDKKVKLLMKNTLINDEGVLAFIPVFKSKNCPKSLVLSLYDNFKNNETRRNLFITATKASEKKIIIDLFHYYIKDPYKTIQKENQIQRRKFITFFNASKKDLQSSSDPNLSTTKLMKQSPK